jgi:hypothetical protein
MVQGRYKEVYKCFEFEVIFLVNFKADVKRLFNFSKYFVTYKLAFDNDIILRDINKMYVDFTKQCDLKPEWNGKVVPYSEVIKFIDNHRKAYSPNTIFLEPQRIALR